MAKPGPVAQPGRRLREFRERLYCVCDCAVSQIDVGAWSTMGLLYAASSRLESRCRMKVMATDATSQTSHSKPHVEGDSPELPAYGEDGVDLTLIRAMLSLSPVERLRKMQQCAWSIKRLRAKNPQLR